MHLEPEGKGYKVFFHLVVNFSYETQVSELESPDTWKRNHRKIMKLTILVKPYIKQQ